MTRKPILGIVGLLLILMAVGAQQKPKSADVLMGTAMHQEDVEGNLEAAITAAGSDRALAARAQVRIGLCYEKLGNAEAHKAYEIVLSQYADQVEPVRQARERLEFLKAGVAAPKSTEPIVRRLWVANRDWSPSSISPDGRYVAFGRKGLVGIIEVESGRDAPLDDHPANTDLLGWTPDGKAVLFTSERSGTEDAWLLAVSDGKPQGPPQLVKKGVPSSGSLDLGRTGSFFYSESREISDVQIAELDPVSGRLVAPPQKASRRWTGITRTPAWSPDGRTLAYVCDYSPRRDRSLVFRSTETGEEREIKTKMDLIGYFICWSKDGKSVVIAGRDDQNRSGLFRVDVQNGESSFLTPGSFGVGFLRFDLSPDGKIGYVMLPNPANPGQAGLYARDLATGKDTLLLQRKLIFSVAVSPDGQRLLMGAGNDGSSEISLLIMPAAGGEPREIIRIDAKEANMRVAPVWTPDGRSVLFAKGKRGAATRDVQLWRVPAEGGVPQKLDLIVDELWWISPHPDGRRIAFSDWWGETAIWTIENFLPKR
jgi:Tol biopolymer transport system component